MNNHEAPELITVPEHVKVKPSIDVEVMEIHTSDDIEVTHAPEYVSSSEFHIPAMSTELGKRAVGKVIDIVPGVERIVMVNPSQENEVTPFVDPKKVPGTDAYAQHQAEISNLAYSELAATKMHSR